MLQPTEDLESLVGQTLKMKFLEVDEEQERVVFSARRAHSETFTSSFKVQFSSCRASHTFEPLLCTAPPAPQRLHLPVWHGLCGICIWHLQWPGLCGMASRFEMPHPYSTAIR